VVSGDADRLISNEYSCEMAELIPRAKLEILAQCGHLAPMEQPEALVEAMDEWLKS
jgi:pimeloyl-ACP methyl ester carboxylesterase